MNEHQKIMIGSKWRFEHWRGDRLIAERVQENLVPNEFIDHLLDVVLSGGGQVTDTYGSIAQAIAGIHRGDRLR